MYWNDNEPRRAGEQTKHVQTEGCAQDKNAFERVIFTDNDRIARLLCAVSIPVRAGSSVRTTAVYVGARSEHTCSLSLNTAHRSTADIRSHKRRARLAWKPQNGTTTANRLQTIRSHGSQSIHGARRRLGMPPRKLDVRRSLHGPWR